MARPTDPQRAASADAIVEYLATLKPLLAIWDQTLAMPSATGAAIIIGRLQAVMHQAQQIDVPDHLRLTHQLLLDAFLGTLDAYLGIGRGRSAQDTQDILIAAGNQMTAFRNDVTRQLTAYLGGTDDLAA
jgi:hypothetical protein